MFLVSVSMRVIIKVINALLLMQRDIASTYHEKKHDFAYEI